MTTRKNQTKMLPNEWDEFIDAIDNTHGVNIPAPPYRAFKDVHIRAMDPNDMEGMSWGVHWMGATHPGINFLSWHRWFVLQLEKRLKMVHPNVSIPYWDAIQDKAVPQRLADPLLLTKWSVRRGTFNPRNLANQSDLDSLKRNTTFQTFQAALEGAIHISVHNAFGSPSQSDIAGNASPNDPLFWLHHANIDRIWADWQKTNNSTPTNMDYILQPSPIFGIKVLEVQSIQTLGYNYV